jgi:pyruvate/2-oxoglutarate/acetoin dehydrogenase E1 component
MPYSLSTDDGTTVLDVDDDLSAMQAAADMAAHTGQDVDVYRLRSLHPADRDGYLGSAYGEGQEL